MIPEGQIETGCLGTCETSFAQGSTFWWISFIFVEVFHCVLTSEALANAGSGVWDFSCLLLSLEILGHKINSLIVGGIRLFSKNPQEQLYNLNSLGM